MLNKEPVYIDPLSDFGFKHIFGNELNKEILIAFLNAVFEGQKYIVDIKYSPTEHQGENKDQKKVFFDLMCSTDNGEDFIVEMQRNKQKYFRDRCVYYISRLINEQIPTKRSHWKTPLREVYLIGLLDFCFQDTREGKYFQDICLMNIDTNEKFYDKLGFKFLELPNFVKKEEDLVTDLDKWFYLLKNMHLLDKKTQFLNEPIFQQVFKSAIMENLTYEERIMEIRKERAESCYQGALEYAAEEAAEKAKKVAEKENKEAILKIAANLKKQLFPILEIAKATNLTTHEIQAL